MILAQVTATAEPSALEMVAFLLSGFLIVMITLTLLWMATSTISMVLRTLGLHKVPVVEKPATATVAASIPDEVIAVITAAVNFATGGSAKIAEIRKK
jgi:Na+-transporting methylmalonyl-CoA/oxaloacetate decarboxylase gamma subunit